VKRLLSSQLSKNIKCNMHGSCQCTWTKSQSYQGYISSFQALARNCCNKMAPAAKQGSITLAQALGGASNQVPATRWRPNTHAHAMSGPKDHRILADQSSHIHLMGSPSNLAPAAGASFIFPVLTTEGPSDPATTSNKDPYALAHTTVSSSSMVSSAIGNIYLQAHTMEVHNGQVLTTARSLTTQVHTMG